MKEEFWGKGEDSDIPWAFEIICVDANGNSNANKCSSTHFDIEGEEISVNYTKFDNSEQAIEALDNQLRESEKTIRSGIIKNQNDQSIGKKMLIIRSSGNFSRDYSLLWTHNARLTQISSKSLDAIEKYEKDRNL